MRIYNVTPWNKYIEIKHPVYVYLKIIPDKSIRNYNSSIIAKAISHMYYNLTNMIIKIEKKYIIQTQIKCSYMIDIYENNVNFYFIVPKQYKNLAEEKIRETWKKCTIEQVSGINQFKQTAEIYQLSYKREDALSLKIDKKSNEPLNSVLNVMDIMKDDDRISIFYNFGYYSNNIWKNQYQKTIDKIKMKKPVDKYHGKGYLCKTFLNGLIGLLDTILDIFFDFTGGKKNTNKLSLLESVADLVGYQTKPSLATKYKRNSIVLNTQIIVASDSNDLIRKSNNANSVCQSFKTIDEDNSLTYKKVKTCFNIEDTKIKNIESNIVSVDECQNFIQLPGRALLKDFKIDYVKILENPVPEELQNGTKCLGNVKYKGTLQTAYLENEYNIGNLPLTLIGSQGSGKTTYISNYCSYCEKANESVIIIDFIKDCELSNDIKRVIPKNKIIEVDLGTENDIQGLGYNEIQIKDSMSNFQKLKLANLQSQQIMSLVDAISVGDPLSSRMRRFLNSAANVVLVQGYNSVKSVIDCLEKYEKRKMYINNLNEELKTMLEDELSTLAELDEWSKVSKDNPSELIGTKLNKIEHILDRMSLLREDFKLKYMYNKSLKNNINLVECMEKGKIVFIKMNENDFPTPMIKNIMVTYWVSKIWLASQIRGGFHKKPTRTNIIIDEIFQAPTCMDTLNYILPQSRKFGCKFLFSTQYIKQLDKIFNSLEASGSSYMLLKGCTENDFNYFKTKLNDFEYEDIMDMEQFNSLNLIYYSKGFSSFISKLPKPIRI